ncbi:Uncharacterised protein [Halioglobus japonicus]|nr:Uncharacterised protein [Halioglobus japonicus]
MQIIDVETWEEFEAKLVELEALRDEASEKRYGAASKLLYRGQSNSEWLLETTLERYCSLSWTVGKYARLVSSAKPVVETFTNKKWDVPEFPIVEKWALDYDNMHAKALPGYEFLVYLRHHGFPSPLLDWSMSPYVAAFFSYERTTADRVAIYVYLESTGAGKADGSGIPQIRSIGPYVSAHPRHFLQQSQYTICVDHQDTGWHYAFHEDVLDKEHDGHQKEQDLLWKITIPASERIKVLKKLDAFNLNGYSLLQSEESLLQMIALREVYFSEKYAL